MSSVLDRVFDSSDSEELYSPNSEDDEESEEAEASEAPSTSIQRERDGATISSSDSDVEPPKKKTRKQLRTPENWRKNKRKQRRNSGKKYTSTTGSLVSVFYIKHGS